MSHMDPHPCPVCGTDIAGMSWEEGFDHNEQHVKELLDRVKKLEEDMNTLRRKT